MKNPFVAICIVAGLAAVTAADSKPAMPDATPVYNAAGELMFPVAYREWIYLSSGFDMSYSATSGLGMHAFDNVFVNPEAYRVFVERGTWPDKTVMVLEARSAQSKGSINQSGYYQASAVMDTEVHIKDEARFPGKWAFFAFPKQQGPGKLFPRSANCYSCHEQHAAVDTTFVQFYPSLTAIAEKKGTLSPGYLNSR